MKSAHFATIAIVWLAACSVAKADTVQLAVGQPLPRVGQLQPGTHRYIRYTINSDGSRSIVDIWQRRLSFEIDQKLGPVIHLVQRWDEVGGKVVLIQDSYVHRSTFAPITHIRHVERDGKTQIGGYRFVSGKVIGMGELPDNGRKDFVMAMPEASYNFEYDMELLQALPLAQGRVFDIPFYDAGVDPKPDRYRYVVAGDAQIASWDGAVVDCWLVTADYNTGKTKSRFGLRKRARSWFEKTQSKMTDLPS